MKHFTAADWIHALKLSPHPEGGHFAVASRSSAVVPQRALPQSFSGERNFFSSIYYLLEAGDFSAFHRLRSDEVWYYHAGCAMNIYTIHPNGFVTVRQLGCDTELQEQLQIHVPPNTWLAAQPAIENRYALVGCMMAPAFDERDWEMADRENLLRQFPQHEQLILRFTR
jgi:hypothetical protein